MGKCPVAPVPGGGEKPFVVGTYTGDGTNSRLVATGFQPSAVLVATQNGGFETKDFTAGGLCVRGYPLTCAFAKFLLAEIVETGIKVSTAGIYGSVNADGTLYHYIAFR